MSKCSDFAGDHIQGPPFAWDQEYHDLTPRYAPAQVMTVLHGMQPVVSYRFHPMGQHPEQSPIRSDMGVLRLVTVTGDSRWYGCQRAYINSELRMVVIGTDVRDKVRREWPVVPEKLR